MPVKKPSRLDELPEGFSYQPEFISLEEEQELVRRFATLQFHAFDFQGYIAKRRNIEDGYEYNFRSRRASAAPAIPDFLKALQERAAAWISVAPHEIVEAVITDYPAGAPIGWHRDVPQFEAIVGISLASRCRMRLKPHKQGGAIVSVILEPRSVYCMRGPARWKYQHSIPAVGYQRYSITFRS